MIRFEEPAPACDYRRESRDSFIAELRKRPGVWALLGQHASPGGARTLAWSIRHEWPTEGGTFEADCRRLCGENRIYARFVEGQ